MYKATTFGFSALQGPHHEAQKSTIVTLPKLCFKLTILPSGFGAEKSEVHLLSPSAGEGAGGVCIDGAPAAADPGLSIWSILVLIDFPTLVS